MDDLGGHAAVGGWPAAATLTVPNFRIEGGAPDIPEGLAWRAEDVRFRVALLHPRILEIAPEGRQFLRVSDWPEISYTARLLQAELPIEPDVPPQAVDVLAEELRADVPAGAPTRRPSWGGSWRPIGRLPRASLPSRSISAFRGLACRPS